MNSKKRENRTLTKHGKYSKMLESNQNGIPEKKEELNSLSDQTKEALFELALTLRDISIELIKEGKIIVINGELFDPDEYNQSKSNTGK